MDYESEEDEAAAEDKPEEEVGEEEVGEGEGREETIDNGDARPVPSGPEPTPRKKKKRRGSNAIDTMRLNLVLASHQAIQGYSYDTEHNLWCQVCCLLVTACLDGQRRSGL